MNLKFCLVLFFKLIAVVCLAQNDTAGVITYHVIGSKSADYEIFPYDNYLFVGCNNIVKIKASVGGKIADIVVANGKIIKTKTEDTYVIYGLAAGTTILTIYEKDKKGNKIAVKNKQYSVVDYPKLKFAGTKCDSVISRILFCGGLFFAEYDLNHKTPIISFKMDKFGNSKFGQDSTDSNKINKTMRDYVSSLKEGDVVCLSDIKYKHVDGTIITVPIFRLFIGNESEKPFGF